MNDRSAVLSRMLALAACAGMVSACASTGALPPPLTPTSRYVLQVEPGMDRIALAVHDQGLSGNQQAALAALAGRFTASRADVIRVEAPAGDDPAAARAAWSVRDALAALGVPAERVQVTAYAAPDPRAPVLAGFEVLTAHVPNCAEAQRASVSSFSNQPSAAFGCAVTANLAAQIANPRDIVAPAAIDAAEAGRRAKVFDTYRAGTPTSAPQEPLVNGRISRAVD
ncbi:CpaD family pilus assembly lipoprotein [Brevundimonas sp.]|uniref:CpaD family pilus assembly lipoprotein n=1 Tax=Brevundimonas sp. TaxID=1871086 RepID=UPI0025C3D0C9|nr:CpaD family pilus assembly lipoprotein [Brevundimonas sp.]